MKNKEGLISHIRTNGKDKSWAELALEYGFTNGEVARCYYKSQAFKNQKIVSLEEQSFKKENLDKGTLESTTETTFEPVTHEQLAQLHKIDLSKYRISSYWSKLKGNGKFTSSVLATAKKPEDFDLQLFTDFLKTYEPTGSIKVLPNISYNRTKDAVEVEISLADFHLDRLTLLNDNIDQRVEEYMSVLYELASAANNAYNVSKYNFIIGNDFYNTDNFQGATTNGTPQEISVSWNVAYEKGFDLMVRAIWLLQSTKADVNVILVQGNHGRTKEYYMAHALEVYFKNESKIKFDRTYSPTKFVVSGDTFIGYHHGNTKIDELPLLFATSPSSAKAFGNAKYREVHTADKHHYMAKEVKGVRIQQIPCMVNPDTWSSDNNYVNNIRAGLALVYHPTKGKIAEFEGRI